MPKRNNLGTVGENQMLKEQNLTKEAEHKRIKGNTSQNTFEKEAFITNASNTCPSDYSTHVDFFFTWKPNSSNSNFHASKTDSSIM